MEHNNIVMKTSYLNFVILSLFLLSCTSNPKESKKSEFDQVAQSSYQVLNPSAFKTALTESNNYLLIDVRTANEFMQGSIENAQNFDILNGSFQNQISKWDKSKPIFVFCAKGGRSNKASKTLQKEGFKNIFDLKGGFTAWKRVQK